MQIDSFLSHVRARESGRKLEHACNRYVFPAAADRERWLAEPLFVEVPTDAEWEQHSIEMHQVQAIGMEQFLAENGYSSPRPQPPIESATDTLRIVRV